MMGIPGGTSSSTIKLKQLNGMIHARPSLRGWRLISLIATFYSAAEQSLNFVIFQQQQSQGKSAISLYLQPSEYFPKHQSKQSISFNYYIEKFLKSSFVL